MASAMVLVADSSKKSLDAGALGGHDINQDACACLVPQMDMNDTDFESGRNAMIEWQLRRRGIRDERVLRAMQEVPRHEFVPLPFQQAAYEDRPIAIGEAQTISQPYMVAAMTEAAHLNPGDKVLEIGTGSGYQAAILAHLGAQVISMERIRSLADSAQQRLTELGYNNVRVIPDDGSTGYPERAPYAAIMVTAAAPAVPQVLISQLAEGGRLVIPVGTLQLQTLQVISKHADRLSVRDLDPCQFVPLVGKQAWPEKMS
jgi:protein-L-isoaspartate(D-aspartate) O-methyltransferase